MKPPSATTPKVSWPWQVGNMRPWERATANETARAYEPDKLKAAIEALAEYVTSHLPPPLSPADLETIMRMSLDISAIFRGVAGSAKLIKDVPNAEMSWLLLLNALKGMSYTALYQELETMERANDAVRATANVVRGLASLS